MTIATTLAPRPSAALWIPWAASVAVGFILLWHDTQFGQYGPFQIAPHPKFILGLALIVGAAFFAIGFSLAGFVT